MAFSTPNINIESAQSVTCKPLEDSKQWMWSTQYLLVINILQEQT